MVTREQITPDLEEIRRAIRSAELIRNPNGEWTLIMEIAGIIKIDEHRRVGIYGEVRLRGGQIGRKPNPPRKTNKAGKFAKSRKQSSRPVARDQCPACASCGRQLIAFDGIRGVDRKHYCDKECEGGEIHVAGGVKYRKK